MILNDGFEGVETDCKLMITDVHSPVVAQVLLNPHCRIYQCCFSGGLVHRTCHFLRTFGNKNLDRLAMLSWSPFVTLLRGELSLES